MKFLRCLNCLICKISNRIYSTSPPLKTPKTPKTQQKTHSTIDVLPKTQQPKTTQDIDCGFLNQTYSFSKFGYLKEVML